MMLFEKACYVEYLKLWVEVNFSRVVEVDPPPLARLCT